MGLAMSKIYAKTSVLAPGGEDDTEVILNVHVINEIAKYVDFQDLKSLRRVNKLWSAGATPTFVKNAAISLRYGYNSLAQLRAFGTETEKLVGIKALRFCHHPRGAIFEREAARYRQIISRLAPNLTSLVLINWGDDLLLVLGPSTTFPALSTLTFDNSCFNVEAWPQLYLAAPAISALVYQRSTFPFWEELLSVFSSLLSEDGARNLSLVPRLASLKVSQPLGSKNLGMLEKFPPTWASLDICLRLVRERGSVEDELGALFPLLEKNKEALVALKLRIVNFRSRDPNRQTLRFPAIFSKLERLELDFKSIHPGFSLGGRELHFSKAMPKLRSLSLKLAANLECAGPIWASFFPPQVFGGLKLLKVEGMMKNVFMPAQEIGQDWAEKMFPNARLQIS